VQPGAGAHLRRRLRARGARGRVPVPLPEAGRPLEGAQAHRDRQQRPQPDQPPQGDGLMAGPTTGLAGKAVIVTAAAAGIGRATARAFAAEGSRLVLGDIDGPGLTAVANELRAEGTTVVPVEADVTTPEGAA